MKDRYLLDTNILSALLADPRGLVASHIARVGDAALATSIVIAAELRYGAAKKGSPRLSERVEALLDRLPVLALEAPSDQVYGEVRADLERRGQLIGPNDLLIASHAIAADRTLVSDNVSEFSRITGLRLENWRG